MLVLSFPNSLLGIKILSECSRCEREGQFCHLQGEVRTVSYKKKNCSAVSKISRLMYEENYAKGHTKTILPTHCSRDDPNKIHATFQQLRPCGKTIYLSG